MSVLALVYSVLKQGNLSLSPVNQGLRQNVIYLMLTMR